MIVEYVKKKKVPVTLYDIYCDFCDTKLEPVFKDGDDSFQLKDALVINFKGGYGMYIDSILGTERTAVLCKECADKLINMFPKFESVLDGSNWKVK